MLRPIVVIWDNFGFSHNDRCEALAKYYYGRRDIVGVEISGSSDTYNWASEPGVGFRKVTLYSKKRANEISIIPRAYYTLLACLRLGRADVFLCHYENFATFAVAIILRILGSNTYVMNNSKFDDKKRHLLREAMKSIFLTPYRGALVAGARSVAYLRFLGVPSNRIATGYNSLSLARVRACAGCPPAPEGAPLAERHFTIVARFTPKKNLFLALEAYSVYCSLVDTPRILHLAGYGPLERELLRRIDKLHLDERVVFHKSLANPDVCRLLATTSVLLLPSIEEQFGNVVIEAQAMGLPVIISDNCGAWDHLVRSSVNGFVVEPDNAEGLAYFMKVLSTDENLWRQMCFEAQRSAELGDVKRFAEGVAAVLGDGDKDQALRAPGLQSIGSFL